jgi:hypothetical protein
LVVANGRIFETGTFDEVLRRSGLFSELARAQFAMAAPTAPLRQPEALGAKRRASKGRSPDCKKRKSGRKIARRLSRASSAIKCTVTANSVTAG